MSRGRTLAGLAMLGALAGAGMVSAQPTTQSQPPLLQPPPAAQPSPLPNGPVTPPAQPPPAPEEAPPTQVAPPPPVAAPPIAAEEVEPAPAPKAQVAAKPAEAAKRARYDVAVIQALDKVSAESMRFEAAVGRPVRYKNLVFTVKACERSAADEAIEDSVAHVTVESQPRAAPGKPTPPPRQAFRGWMYASSPGLNPLEHPIYDAWLITCRAAAPVPTAAR
ncbi:MAG: DUF2155 domain-containing protein [Phenylobacterium sp.]|uniref:DUF2155 domain-containing protein n=1 Tax=Phenylobacterium sp. TaxID=1871053 RepID=UPI0025FD7058|nr:DUF2155 domain-containing protein [Phenylobacterium sp.]MBA4012278.1 DUF2155 domain-containing protein [Phenylobacterium sp.]